MASRQTTSRDTYTSAVPGAVHCRIIEAMTIRTPAGRSHFYAGKVVAKDSPGVVKTLIDQHDLELNTLQDDDYIILANVVTTPLSIKTTASSTVGYLCTFN